MRHVHLGVVSAALMLLTATSAAAALPRGYTVQRVNSPSDSR